MLKKTALAMVVALSACGPSAEQKKLSADLTAGAKALEDSDKTATESLRVAVESGNAAIQAYDHAKAESAKGGKKAAKGAMMVSENADKAAESLKAAIAEAGSVAPANVSEAMATAEKFAKKPGKVEEMKTALSNIQNQMNERVKSSEMAVEKIQSAKAALEQALAAPAKAKM
ncbi:hypothetical protein CHS0354_023965 [Potamilus streckersoni]|uniref:Uncharacterized protein n=1 Tax=Potamilus streckersoni TaxID=2493646 RepID=A0AAE0VLL9_9BIVA|nr:hypothetical protein CHS0354_023965 [Potamilus streckersoni]